MAYRASVLSRNASLVGLTSLFNVSPTLNIYSTATSQPATPEAGVPTSSVLLVSISMPSPTFGTPSAAVATANSVPYSGIVSASGAAGWFSFVSSGNMVGNGTVTLNGASGDMTFDNTSFVVNGVVIVTGLSIAQPM